MRATSTTGRGSATACTRALNETVAAPSRAPRLAGPDGGRRRRRPASRLDRPPCPSRFRRGDGDRRDEDDDQRRRRAPAAGRLLRARGALGGAASRMAAADHRSVRCRPRYAGRSRRPPGQCAAPAQGVSGGSGRAGPLACRAGIVSAARADPRRHRPRGSQIADALVHRLCTSAFARQRMSTTPTPPRACAGGGGDRAYWSPSARPFHEAGRTHVVSQPPRSRAARRRDHAISGPSDRGRRHLTHGLSFCARWRVSPCGGAPGRVGGLVDGAGVEALGHRLLERQRREVGGPARRRGGAAESVGRTCHRASRRWRGPRAPGPRSFDDAA